MLQLKSIFSLLGICFPVFMFGFTLTVTPTTETCSGNATLSFVSTNITPGGSIEYFVYKLPNISVPYASTTTALLGGLTAGNYRVVAVETVGAITTSQQQDVTILNAIVPLEFTVQSLNQACATVSNISVEVTSGNAVSYEIFEGPITFPSQNSNLFSNLVVGVYKIRVFDACGIGVVSTFTVTLNPTGLNIGAPFFNNASPPSCTSIIATQTITPSVGTVIAYPVSVVYTIHPPNGDPDQTFTQVLSNGDPLSQNISQLLPAFVNQDYNYDIMITDACTTVTSNSFVNSQTIDLRPNIFSLGCNENFLKLNTTNFTPPFTLNFSTFPAGFDPAVLNASYPGPYTDAVVQFGDENNTIPLGTYSVTITDVCGRMKSITFNVLDVPPVPNVIATNNGCLTNTGKIAINIPGYTIATAIVVSAPSSYPTPLPHDVTSLIDTSTGILTLASVPLGDYIIQLTDLCSSVMNPVDVSIPIYTTQPLITEARAGCELQKSSIKVASGNSVKLSSVTITAAPSNFGFALPYNGSTNIASDGAFYISNLPSGNYSITATDECGFTNSVTLTVAGYTIINSRFDLQTNCGSFDLDLDFMSNATTGETYWLQKQLSLEGNSWGHPLTDVPYVENSIPDATNSFPLTNHAINYNLAFNGTFRVVRSFFSFNNGNANNVDKSCIEYLSPTLQFDESLEILDAHRMPCSPDGSLDVILEVNGGLPLHYTITEKDGAAFSFDNGTSNIFHNLDPGVYVFEVEDNCGNIVTRIFDVGALGSLITVTKPDDQLQCVISITNNETFDLSALNEVILGTQSLKDYTLNYFTSQVHAQSGNNAIANPSNYNPTNNPQTVYAAVRYNELPNCYELTSFELYVGQTPTLNLNSNYQECGDNSVIVNAAVGNLPTTTYQWSNGSSDPEITITEPGITNLTVTATNTYGANLSCTTTKEIQIIISKPPKIDRIETVDWTDDENSISIISSTPESFDYAIDGSDFQSNPVFNNLRSGEYTVTIKDKLGCGEITKVVWLLNYPKFFTPNGDGYNDYWFIEHSENEPDFKVEVFDRYGKLLKVFTSRDQGWDGMYNGREISSSDYWFVVHRQDGKIFKGHFTLKR